MNNKIIKNRVEKLEKLVKGRCGSGVLVLRDLLEIRRIEKNPKFKDFTIIFDDIR